MRTPVSYDFLGIRVLLDFPGSGTMFFKVAKRFGSIAAAAVLATLLILSRQFLQSAIISTAVGD